MTNVWGICVVENKNRCSRLTIAKTASDLDILIRADDLENNVELKCEMWEINIIPYNIWTQFETLSHLSVTYRTKYYCDIFNMYFLNIRN